jgi:hypothetical protein
MPDTIPAVRFLSSALLAYILAIATAAGQPTALDAACTRYWAADNFGDAAKAAGDLVKSGASFDEVYARLRQGRTYSKDVATGVIAARHGEFPYTIDVPETYDPSRRYAVRFQLHGGIANSRENAERRGRNGIGRLAGAEQIYVLPASWNDQPWWSTAQLENLRAILDTLKRTYNIDENHVVVSGVSDGGTGAYYVAMRDTTPYASFLPLNGFLGVLGNERLPIEGDLFPGNLRNKPLFVVNGGRDPLYPIAEVEPYLRHLANGRVSITYEPQPQAGHDTSWWPSVKDAYESFVRDHPRRPYPDRLTWETTDTRVSGRAHWLVIDSLGGPGGAAADPDDLNDFTPPPRADMGFRLGHDLRIDRVMKQSMAARLGMRQGDVLVAVGDAAVADARGVLAALQPYPVHSPVTFVVRRGNDTVTLTGTFDPDTVAQPRGPMFRRTGRSGRVDVARHGNAVEVSTRGVSEFTLLFSPDCVDFTQPVRVTVNGRVVHDARIEKDLGTLMKWAARDNDRTMLFGAEIKVKP